MKNKSLIATICGTIVFVNVVEPLLESMGQLCQTWFVSKVNNIQIKMQTENKNFETMLENIEEKPPIQAIGFEIPIEKDGEI